MSSKNRKLQERFLCFDSEGIGYDCEFIVGSENVVIKGHKLLFSASSEVFKSMFYGDLREEKSVKVVDLDPEAFKGMKQFIYTGEMSSTSVFDALLTFTAARKYIVPELDKKCIEYIIKNIQPSDVLQFYERCKVLYISEFDELCEKIIKENTEEVVKSKFFLSSEFETIEFLLKLPSLKLGSECNVFVQFERWAQAEADRKNISAQLISSHFNYLKKHIRFLTMSLKEFISCTSKSFSLTQKEKNIIIQNLMEFNSEPMPEYLSQELQHRELNTALVTPEKFEHTKNFVISINNFCCSCSCSTFTIARYSDLSLKITCTKLSTKYICFQVEFLKSNTKNQTKVVIVDIKSRLRVLADENENDFVSESSFFAIVDYKHITESNKMSFAKFPISKLQDKMFTKRTSDTVIIEASFDIDSEAC